MTEESKEVDLRVTHEVAEETLDSMPTKLAEIDEVDDDEPPDDTNADVVAADASGKRKKPKKSKLKKILAGGKSETGDAGGSSNSSNAASKLTAGMVEQLLEMNPSLKGEVAGMDKDKAAENLKKLEVADLLTGMSVSGKNQKDMASYKFWQTQPVPRFDEVQQIEEGPIKIIDPESVPKEPRALYEGFEWVTMNLTDENELQEVYDLLTGHYVEDDEAMFRFNYSISFLKWLVTDRDAWMNTDSID